MGFVDAPCDEEQTQGLSFNIISQPGTPGSPFGSRQSDVAADILVISAKQPLVQSELSLACGESGGIGTIKSEGI